MAIYQLAVKHKIPIVEDDYDHEFHYRCQPLAPMATQRSSTIGYLPINLFKNYVSRGQNWDYGGK